MSVHCNRLADETSPYLLQHAGNPVDWYPWGPEALTRAARENKPILLSIGYSACHWCHVMAHESFEHEPTAALMNRLFVNIKVDREERPDLDRIHQLALQMLSRRNGGWPLTMFLAPDTRIPFFGGTYYPREPRNGMPAFSEVLEKVAAFYHQQRGAMETQNTELLRIFEALEKRSANPGTPDASALDLARHQLEQHFDQRHGGFGKAPKFPHPANLTRLLRHYTAIRTHGEDDPQALHMVVFTLQRMALGGLNDQLGGGFFRYSVDAQWTIPHFEKMLYDNAQLLPLYAEAAGLTGDANFRRVALETAQWVMREMQSAQGGYYSALDADSEGEEGRFYAWTPDEVQTIVGPDAWPLFARRFGLDRPPNFEQRWHLAVVDNHLDHDDDQSLIEAGRRRLFEARSQRLRPGCDDKILVAWNALMIRGMMIAARTLARDELQQSAQRALDFIRDHMWRDGRLLATCRDGTARLPAYLDDYAFLLDAVLEALQTRHLDEDLAFARQLAEALLTHFEDPDQGGFFFTAHDHERLIHRPKSFGDDALPAGNGVAARALLRLGRLVDEPRYLTAAERTLRVAWGQISELPSAHNAMLDALEDYLQPES